MKYNTSGDRLWTRQLGTASDDVARSLTLQGDNIYVAGYTEGSLDGNSSAGSGDIFIVNYASDGSKQWTRQFGSSSYETVDKIVSDGLGNLYVIGETSDSLYGNAYIGLVDAFVSKHSSDGARVWTRQFGTNVDDYVDDIAIDGSDNLYLCGETEGSLDGGAPAGGWDTFVVKYNSDGVMQ